MFLLIINLYLLSLLFPDTRITLPSCDLVLFDYKFSNGQSKRAACIFMPMCSNRLNRDPSLIFDFLVMLSSDQFSSILDRTISHSFNRHKEWKER